MSSVRNLVVFMDGTNCDFGKKARREWSNVTRMYKVCEKLRLAGASQQIAQYFDGVGSRKSESVVLDQMFGLALGERVEEAYGWLKKEVANAHADGCTPRIYLFGFSRGAFAVRWLAALLDFCGVPGGNENKFTGIDVFAGRDKRAAQQLLESGRYERIPVAMLGLFDTVKARPGDDYGVGKSPAIVERVFHAIAIDEWRSDFDVLLFDDGDKAVQRWFAGGHSDIGGGYGDPAATDGRTLQERSASDVAFSWMFDRAVDSGLIVSDGYCAPAFDPGIEPVFHDERTWYYKVSNVLASAKKLFLRTIPITATIDESVGVWMSRYNRMHANLPTNAV